MTCNTFRRLAIVVVNYASHALLEANLAAVAQATPDAAVVVVDNFSSRREQHDVQALADSHGWSLVCLPENAGFGAGMNAGVAAAKELGAEAFLLLNPDAMIAADSLALLREALELEPLTLLAPIMYDAGGALWFDGADLLWENGQTRSASRRTEGQRFQPWLSGACLLASAQLWDTVDGFDERYFLYWEDVDLSYRVVLAGGGLRVLKEATAVHDEGGTQTADAHRRRGRAKSNLYYYYNIRNRLLFAALHLPAQERKQWKGRAVAAAREVLLRGGRRQFIRPFGAVSAAVRGTWAGMALVRAAERADGRARR